MTLPLSIIFYLSNNILRKVSEVKSALEMLIMLENLFLEKSLLDHIYVLEQFSILKWIALKI